MTDSSPKKRKRKLWLLAASASIVALLAGLWRYCAPLDHLLTYYVSTKVDEAVNLLETDPTAYLKETQDVIRLVAAAAAENRLQTPEALYVLATQYEREGDYEAAEAVLRQTIDMAPEWSWPHVALGILLARFGDNRLEEAEELLRKGVELQPDWVRPYNSLGVVLRLLGRLEEAETVALQALDIDPYDVAAHNNYANLLVLQDRYEEAEEHYFFAMESEPENAKPPYNLACLYSVVGRHDEALNYLDMAISLSESARVDAVIDPYFDALRSNPGFQLLVYGEEAQPAATTGESVPPPASQE